MSTPPGGNLFENGGEFCACADLVALIQNKGFDSFFNCHNFYFLVGLYDGFSRYPDAYAARACRSACCFVG